jgi:hypothetical protein
MTAKPSAQRGTPEWFKRERLFLIETAKAVDSFSAAVSSFQKLVELGVTADTDVRSALHTTGVINYARPFTNNRSGKGGHRTNFGERIVRGHQGYDDKIHQQLMVLRNKLIAHSDGDYADGRLFRKSLDGHIDSEPFKILVGATVLTLTVNTLDDMELAKRYLAHVKAAEKATQASVAKRLEEFVKAGQQFPDALEAAAVAKPRPSIDTGRFQLSPASLEATVPLSVLNPHTVLKRPNLPIGQDGYKYRSFVMQTDLSTHVKWRNDDGSEGHFKWEVMLGKSPPNLEGT